MLDLETAALFALLTHHCHLSLTSVTCLGGLWKELVPANSYSFLIKRLASFHEKSDKTFENILSCTIKESEKEFPGSIPLFGSTPKVRGLCFGATPTFHPSRQNNNCVFFSQFVVSADPKIVPTPPPSPPVKRKSFCLRDFFLGGRGGGRDRYGPVMS